jgi:hypothetical protein
MGIMMFQQLAKKGCGVRSGVQDSETAASLMILRFKLLFSAKRTVCAGDSGLSRFEGGESRCCCQFCRCFRRRWYIEKIIVERSCCSSHELMHVCVVLLRFVNQRGADQRPGLECGVRFGNVLELFSDVLCSILLWSWRDGMASVLGRYLREWLIIGYRHPIRIRWLHGELVRVHLIRAPVQRISDVSRHGRAD